MASQESKKVVIILRSADIADFVVEETVIMQSGTICRMIESGHFEDSFPLRNINSHILRKVIKYCKKHVESAANSDEELKAWDAEFVNIDYDTLGDLNFAAKYLDIKGLSTLTSKALTDKIMGMSLGETDKILNIEDDFTLEEEESEWAFE